MDSSAVSARFLFAVNKIRDRFLPLSGQSTFFIERLVMAGYRLFSNGKIDPNQPVAMHETEYFKIDM